MSDLLHPDIAWNATYPSITGLTAFTMDFLPLPDGLSEHELVPELPGAPYDNQGFSGYDVRQGWNVKLLREGNIRGARSEWNEYSQASLAEHGDDVHEFSGEQLVQFLVAPFIQNWVIYGLFQEALGRHISRDDATFTCINERGEMRRYLTLKRLVENSQQGKKSLLMMPNGIKSFQRF